MVVLACAERVSSSWYGSHLQLLDDLFTNYSKAVRPGGADGSTSVVEMVLRPVKLLNLDERAESIELKMIIEVYWHDHSLMWDESSYNDISSIHTEQSKLWLPPIIIENSLTKTDRLSEYGNKLISIDSEGNLLWTILDNYLTTCDIDISFYPFDEQDCQISLSTFPIPESHVSIKVDSPRRPLFNTVWFNTGGTWQLVESYFHVISYDPKSSYFYTGFEKSFEYHLRLRRRTTFYIFNIILPVVFLSLTTTIVFLLPAEAGEKMGVSMAVLLAYSVYLSIIADDLPRTSSQVCYLQVYLTMLHTGVLPAGLPHHAPCRHRPGRDPVCSGPQASPHGSRDACRSRYSDIGHLHQELAVLFGARSSRDRSSPPRDKPSPHRERRIYR